MGFHFFLIHQIVQIIVSSLLNVFDTLSIKFVLYTQGIAFSLIIVRIGLGQSSHETTTIPPRPFVAAIPPSIDSHHLGIPMRPVAVHILESKSVQDDDGHIMNGLHDMSSSATMNSDSTKTDPHAMAL